MKARLAALLGLLVGLAAVGLIVRDVGVAAVWHGIRSVGWGFPVLLADRLLLIALMGASWSVLGSGGARIGLPAFVWARLIRDSASECLPLSSVGGFVLGGRALVIAGATWVWATASTVVDVTLETVAQLAYLAGGLFELWRLRPEFPLVRPAADGLGALAVGTFLFLALQARGGRLLERGVARLFATREAARAGVGALVATLAAIHRRPGRVVLCGSMHLGDWLANGVDAYIALLLMGHGVPLRDALVIDSLIYGLRSIAFMIPNGLGVQEAGYVLLGGLFGLSPGTALALSLIRRGRDLLIGIPALAIWQAVEGRRAWRPRADVPSVR